MNVGRCFNYYDFICVGYSYISDLFIKFKQNTKICVNANVPSDVGRFDFIFRAFNAIFSRNFSKKQIKFDKKIVFVLAILLASISFMDVKNRIVYEYKCNIQKDYEIIVLDSSFTLSDLDNMYVDFSGEQDDSKFTKKLNSINIYSDMHKTKVVAKIYNIYCPNSFILASIQKEISGTEGGLSCGYTKTGLLQYNYQLKQILAEKLAKNKR